LSSYFENKRERCFGGNNLSNVTSFIILRSGKGLNSSNKDNILNYLAKKVQMKHSRVSIFWIGDENLDQISSSQSSSSQNLKVSQCNKYWIISPLCVSFLAHLLRHPRSTVAPSKTPSLPHHLTKQGFPCILVARPSFLLQLRKALRHPENKRCNTFSIKVKKNHW